jgi:predicted transcriptional regulator
MRPFALNLPEDLVVRLDSVAASRDRSRSYVARDLLEQALAYANLPAGAAMSGQTIDYDALRRDQLAAAVRGISERIAPPAPEPKKDTP